MISHSPKNAAPLPDSIRSGQNQMRVERTTCQACESSLRSNGERAKGTTRFALPPRTPGRCITCREGLERGFRHRRLGMSFVTILKLGRSGFVRAVSTAVNRAILLDTVPHHM